MAELMEAANEIDVLNARSTSLPQVVTLTSSIFE